MPLRLGQFFMKECLGTQIQSRAFRFGKRTCLPFDRRPAGAWDHTLHERAVGGDLRMHAASGVFYLHTPTPGDLHFDQLLDVGNRALGDRKAVVVRLLHEIRQLFAPRGPYRRPDNLLEPLLEPQAERLQTKVDDVVDLFENGPDDRFPGALAVHVFLRELTRSRPPIGPTVFRPPGRGVREGAITG
jgi:hypothetical protein